jgi:hypothetical protein
LGVGLGLVFWEFECFFNFFEKTWSYGISRVVSLKEWAGVACFLGRFWGVFGGRQLRGIKK